MRIRVGRVVAGFAMVVAVAGVAVWALAFSPARQWPVVAQLVAVDRLFAAGFAVAAATGAIVWLVRRSWLTAAVVLALIVPVILFSGRVLAQGVGPGVEPLSSGFVAVSWNADEVAPGAVAGTVGALREESGADVIVLPETGWHGAEIVRGLLVEGSHDVEVFAPQGTATSVIMSSELAKAYRIDESSPPWAGLALLPEEPSPQTPVIVATHLQQPSVGSTEIWLDHLSWVALLCDSTPFVVVLGDMNTTLNHLGGPGLGGCRDVAASTGAGAASTWPAWLPDWLGVSIDRFMVGAGYEGEPATFTVRRDVELGGADHWPVVVSVAAG